MDNDNTKDALKYNEALANNNNIEIKKIENLLQNKLIKSQRIIKEINKKQFYMSICLINF